MIDITLKLPVTTIVVCFVLQTVWIQIRLLRGAVWSGSTQFAYMQKCFGKFARIFSRWHKQMTFSDAGFLGILRVNLRAQRRFRSAWAFAPSDPSLCCALNGLLRTQAFFIQTAKTDQSGWMPRLIWVFAGRTSILLIFSSIGSCNTKAPFKRG